MCGYANNYIVCFKKPLLVNIVGNMHIPNILSIIGNKKYFPVIYLDYYTQVLYKGKQLQYHVTIDILLQEQKFKCRSGQDLYMSQEIAAVRM